MELKNWREIAIDAPEDAEEASFPTPYGMKAWKNRGNRFLVVACHYSADPRKRNDEWYTKACEGLRPDQIERELELNFNSKAGSKAFPYLEGNEKYFRAEPPNPIPQNWKIIGALDWGARNPTAFVWFAVDTHRRFWAFDEFYTPMNKVHGGLPAFADYLKKHPYYTRLKMIVADPKMFSKDQNIITKETGLPAHGTLKSVVELLMSQGVHKIQRANNDRVLGLQRLQQLFNYRGEGLTRPYIFIGKRCQKMWWEFTNLVYKLDANDSKNPDDDVVKRNDHVYDATRYGILSEDMPAEIVVEESKAFHTLQVLEDEIDEKHAKDQYNPFSITASELDGDFYEQTFE